jgi:CubicO group peptidase (beta-lactamase class C family)
MDQPSARWRYNTGAELLGVLLARAARMPFDEVLRRRVLDPLGMKDTAFFVPASSIGRLPTSYFADPRTDVLAVYDRPDGEWSRPPAFPSAAAGLVSTVDDLVAFGRAMANGGALGDARILSSSTVESMTTDQITAEQKAASRDALDPDFWKRHGWGLGLGLIDGGGFGWDGGLGTSLWWYPSRDLVAVLMTQRGAYPAHCAVHRDFWRGVLVRRTGRPPTAAG